MWPMVPISKELVTVSLSPEAITFAWFSYTSKQLQLNASSTHIIENLEFVDGLLFSFAAFNSLLQTFIEHHALKHPAISCSLAGPGVQEKMVTLPTATPGEKHFAPMLTQSIVWDYLYLYPDEGNFNFYVFGLSKKQLAQYTALACMRGYEFTKLTTATAAMLELYKHVHGKKFRYSQLAHDLAACDHRAHNLVNIHDARKLIIGKIPIKEIDLKQILPCIGMAYSFFKETP